MVLHPDKPNGSWIIVAACRTDHLIRRLKSPLQRIENFVGAASAAKGFPTTHILIQANEFAGGCSVKNA